MVLFLWFNIFGETGKDWEIFKKKGSCNKLMVVSSLYDVSAALHAHGSSITPKVTMVVPVYTAKAH